MSDKAKKELKEWGKALIFAVIVAILMMIFARPSFVRGVSMMGTFKEGDLVLVERITQLYSEPERFDIIVAESDLLTEAGDKKNLIKRVIGLPGDSVIIKDGNVYINGEKLEEDYLYEGSTGGEFEGVVPDEHLFIMGDNRYHSNDSRAESVGFVSYDRLRGRVYMRIYPFSEIKTF